MRGIMLLLSLTLAFMLLSACGGEDGNGDSAAISSVSFESEGFSGPEVALAPADAPAAFFEEAAPDFADESVAREADLAGAPSAPGAAGAAEALAIGDRKVINTGSVAVRVEVVAGCGDAGAHRRRDVGRVCGPTLPLRRGRGPTGDDHHPRAAGSVFHGAGPAGGAGQGALQGHRQPGRVGAVYRPGGAAEEPATGRGATAGSPGRGGKRQRYSGYRIGVGAGARRDREHPGDAELPANGGSISPRSPCPCLARRLPSCSRCRPRWRSPSAT